MLGKSGKKSLPSGGARRGTKFLIEITPDMTDEDLDRVTDELCRALDEEAREKGGPAKRKGRRPRGTEGRSP
jgi:hypothetical protein